MTIQYTWSFPQLDVAPSDGVLNDVIKTVHWRLDATDGPYSAGDYGSVALNAPQPEAFVPFDGLTEEKLIEWVSAEFDLEAIQQSLVGQIAAKKNPKTYSVENLFQ